MTIQWGMTLIELVAAALFLLTAVLLLYAMAWRYRLSARVAAVASIMSVSGANSFFLMSYAGEQPFVTERPGPIKRSRGGERGTFAFETEGDGGGAANQHGSGGDRGSALASAEDGRSGDATAQASPQTFKDCPGCPEMVVIRPGVFRMGAAPEDPAAREAERPTRVIGFAAPFAIGRTEVTIGAYAAFTAATGRAAHSCPDAKPGDDDPKLPVTCVSARDADDYAAWLAKRTGQLFRLPSEAEWEYAARAGATTAFATGLRLERGQANIDRGTGLTVRVGSFPTNAFGVADMHGNAAEIVAGNWTASPALLPGDGKPAAINAPFGSRVLRDAHAGEPVVLTRLSARRSLDPAARLPGVGFRLARDMK